MTINLSARHLRAFIAVANVQNLYQGGAKAKLVSTLAERHNTPARRYARRPAFRAAHEVGASDHHWESYLGVAQRLLSEMDSSAEVVRDLLEKRKGNLHIASLPSVAAGILARELSRFRDSYPNIGISLQDGFNQSVLERVRRGDVDMAFVHLDRHDDSLHSTLLYEENYSLICSPDHPLAGSGPIRWIDIVDFPFIQVAQGSSTYEISTQAFAKIGHVLRSKIEANYVSTAVGMAAEGLGVTVLPTKGFRLLAGRCKVIARPLTAPTVNQRIHLAVRKNSWPSPAASAFRDQVLKSRWEDFWENT